MQDVAGTSVVSEYAVQLGYAQLRETILSARSEGVRSFDLTRILEDRSWKDEVYFDRSRVNHLANRLIAQRMFDSI